MTRSRASSPARGFTLTELAFTLAVVAVLATLAYPAYTASLRRVERAQAVVALLTVAAAQERHRAIHGRYAASLASASRGGLGLPDSTRDAGGESRWYRIAIVLDRDGARYVATAEPQGDQARDTCGALGVAQDGRRTPDDPRCW